MLYLVAGLSAGLTGVCLFTLRIAFSFLTVERASMTTERERWVDERADERMSMDVERASWATERANLCQRLQAPAEAVMQHAMSQPLPSPPAVPMDDDNAFWEAQMSKEQLASLAAQAELSS